MTEDIDTLRNDGYASLINELKTKIAQARIRAHLSVNKEIIMLYWDIFIQQAVGEIPWGELDEAVCANFAHTASDSKSYTTKYFNLYMMISAVAYLATTAKDKGVYDWYSPGGNENDE
jgi:hypothetical protein